jgi:tyrosine-protein phosphatase YwqE
VHFLFKQLKLINLFFFNKQKIPLKELLSGGYTDIHSHLIFDIDDGAKNADDTLFLTKSLIDFGTEFIITTPHTIQFVWENSKDNILGKHKISQEVLTNNDINIDFKVASEYLIDESFVNRFKTETLLTLKDNYVLIEMSYINAPIQLYEIIFDLQVAGYKPLLAHPERYNFYYNNYAEYQKLKKAGCLFQLNLLSTVGYYGEQVFNVAKKLLSEGMYDFVGSDAHHQNHIKAFENRLLIKDLNPLKEIIKNNSFFKLK